MSAKARRWLRRKSLEGTRGFQVSPEYGGYAGSLVGLGYIVKDKTWYNITLEGKRWLGVK